MIIDSHFNYLTLKQKDMNAKLPESLVGLEIGLDGGDLKERIKSIGNDRNIFLSVGAGPWVLDRADFKSIDDELQLLEKDILSYGADAIGEIGFDNHWKYGTKENQLELFIKQVQIARKYNLPVSIHSREADEEVLELTNKGFIDNRTVMHCFSSNAKVCKTLLDKGAYISFAGNITYKANIELQECAKIVPLDKILVETDSPYLSPMPLRGKPNNPKNTELVIEYISKLRKIEKEILKERIINNFYTLMGSRESKVKRDFTTI